MPEFSKVPPSDVAFVWLMRTRAIRCMLVPSASGSVANTDAVVLMDTEVQPLLLRALQEVCNLASAPRLAVLISASASLLAVVRFVLLSCWREGIPSALVTRLAKL